MTWSFPLFNKAADKGLRAVESSCKALYAEFTFRPYWNVNFHLCALASVVTHLLRCLNNLLSIMTTVVFSPLLIFTPWNLFFVPIAMIEHLLASVISLATAVVTPVFFAFRTLFSIFLGYQEGNVCLTWDSSLAEEQGYFNDATAIFIPSA